MRFVEDNWEAPTLGAWGLGWEVWLDGMEITQFTYFQQAGGIELDPVSAEITYGLERIAMYLQGVDAVLRHCDWAPGVTLRRRLPARTSASSRPTTSRSPTSRCCCATSTITRREASRCLDASLPLPAYDQVLKCSHTFNLLDARRAIAVTDRQAYILRMRAPGDAGRPR